MAYSIFLGGKKAKVMLNGKQVVITGILSGSSQPEEPDIPIEPEELLSAPVISLDGNILTITATDDKTETFVILINGVEKATVENTGTEPEEPGELLSAPVISLDGDILTITATDDKTETFGILVNGVEKATVANEETYEVSGTWYFNSDANIDDTGDMYVDVRFTSNGNLYESLKIIGAKGVMGDLYYGDTIVATQIDGEVGADWYNEAYRTITFDGVQIVSERFYGWLTYNAVRQEITFTIDGTTYTALSGMTWAEWCDSEYNVGFDSSGLHIDYSVNEWDINEDYHEDYVPRGVIIRGTHSGGSVVPVKLNGVYVYGTDTIQAVSYIEGDAIGVH